MSFFTLPISAELNPEVLKPENFLINLGLSQQFTDEHDVPVDKLVHEDDLDHFFPDGGLLAGYYGLDENDPKIIAELKRWNRLKDVLKENLRGVKVICVGTVEIRCYIAGITAAGDIAGLVTTEIET